MLVFAKLCVFCEICKISLDPSPGVDSIFFRIEVYSVGADIYERVFAACWQDVVVKGHMAVPCRAGSGEVNVEVCGGETRASIFVNGQRYFYRLVFLSSCPSCSPLATPHNVRCFTHLFCTFIGGKFEAFFRDLNHKTTVRPP